MNVAQILGHSIRKHSENKLCTNRIQTGANNYTILKNFVIQVLNYLKIYCFSIYLVSSVLMHQISFCMSSQRPYKAHNHGSIHIFLSKHHSYYITRTPVTKTGYINI